MHRSIWIRSDLSFLAHTHLAFVHAQSLSLHRHTLCSTVLYCTILYRAILACTLSWSILKTRWPTLNFFFRSSPFLISSPSSSSCVRPPYLPYLPILFLPCSCLNKSFARGTLPQWGLVGAAWRFAVYTTLYYGTECWAVQGARSWIRCGRRGFLIVLAVQLAVFADLPDRDFRHVMVVVRGAGVRWCGGGM